MTENRIADAFERARSDGSAAFIPYLTAGDPSAAGTVELARTLAEAGADVLELGVPFSDPIADGPVLQRAADRALAAGTTLSDVWRIAEEIRSETRLALLLFSYLNPLLHRGLERTAREARGAGLDGVLVTDLPPEEAGEIEPVIREAGLETVFLVSPTSTADRMARAAELSTGFLYVISRPGTTGARASLPADLPATVARARRAVERRQRGSGEESLPVAVGFGISTPPMARAAARMADGVVVGSALVAASEEGGTEGVGRLARRLARACRRDESPKSKVQT
ncbi:MAG TPA: tryptophan synthase subunit alpha [Thermoanaerobaculia bacterium]|nr:tryptophan synthase subunit alpha [Thermoanaerobaculia bacterium]